jgi:hypothetical protein
MGRAGAPSPNGNRGRLKLAVVLWTALLSLAAGDDAVADEQINNLPAEEREVYAERALEFAQCAGLFLASADIARRRACTPTRSRLPQGRPDHCGWPR